MFFPGLDLHAEPLAAAMANRCIGCNRSGENRIIIISTHAMAGFPPAIMQHSLEPCTCMQRQRGNQQTTLVEWLPELRGNLHAQNGIGVMGKCCAMADLTLKGSPTSTCPICIQTHTPSHAPLSIGTCLLSFLLSSLQTFR